MWLLSAFLKIRSSLCNLLLKVFPKFYCQYAVGKAVRLSLPNAYCQEQVVNHVYF